MQILNVGINYKNTPVEIREKLTFSEDTLHKAMIELKSRKSILENVILSTCNRTEIYAVVDQMHTGKQEIKSFFSEWFGVDNHEFTNYLQITENDRALKHLFHVTTGLDSMVLGETQILGQVRDAFLSSQKVKTTGTIFNELFKRAITFSKRAHHETAIGEHAVSISYTAVELVKERIGELQDKRVAIVGAGKMGELAAKNLQSAGVRSLTIINRSYSKAKIMAEKFAAKVEPIKNLTSILKTSDIIFTATGASHFIITKEVLESILKNRKGKPLMLVDIAVPRDIEPAIRKLDGVSLYDIDDLQHMVDENLEERKKAAIEVAELVEGEIAEFKEWLRTLGVVPVISALRKKALGIQSNTMESLERKIPNLTEREKKVLSKHTMSIINQLLKQPISQAKVIAASSKVEENLQLFIDIFGIEEEVMQAFNEKVEKKQNAKGTAKQIR